MDTAVPPKIEQVALTDVDKIKPILFTTVSCSCMATPKTRPQAKTSRARGRFPVISFRTPWGTISAPKNPMAPHTITTDTAYIILINACTGKLPVCFTV